jgi:hypothetical protein
MQEAGVRALPSVSGGHCEYFVDEQLAEKGILVQSVDREGRPDEACCYGSAYHANGDAAVKDIDEKDGRKGGGRSRAAG